MTPSKLNRAAAIALTLSLSVLAATSGCGGASADETPAVPAGGTIKYKGKPLEKGTIQFVPEKGRAAHGTIEDGKFTLTTYTEGDGAIPGKHGVGVVSTKEVAAKKKGAEPQAVYVVPQSYASPGGTKISVNIPPEGKKDIEINLQ